VGSLAGQWLRSRGVRAIGIVGSEEKVATATQNGYEAVFVQGTDGKTSDWPARVRELTGGGAAVVYDPVGQATWEGSIACLAATSCTCSRSVRWRTSISTARERIPTSRH